LENIAQGLITADTVYQVDEQQGWIDEGTYDRYYDE